MAGRRARRARSRGATRRRRLLGAAAALAAAAAVLVAALTGGPHGARRSATARASSPGAAVRAGRQARPARLASPARSGTPRARPRPSAPAPGTLPQTRALPSLHTPRFRSLMASLWQGVVTGSLAPAMPSFFPKAAYLQIKAIPDAAGDWTDRLVHDYGLDIAAAHALLGPHAAQARLVSVNVPAGYGHWVAPGACYNTVGYYEVPNSRVVYSESGQVHSFGIASMISWRGVWYVVHLGAVLREGERGVVDEPASGPGSAAYSGTC
jgi:hypothetical protein